MTDLVGRHAERRTVEQLLVDAQAGRSGALVIRGQAGIGKTALLGHAGDVAGATGFRVENTVGVEAETHFAFAGLHRLCAPLLEHAGALAEPQQAALEVALGLRSGAAPDRFLTALAVLNLLAEAAERTPLLCLVDDAQWIDDASTQVLTFVARRVEAEQIALIFAWRDAGERDPHELSGIPDVRLDGLDEIEAQALLAAAVRSPLDDRVRDRIIAEARGNPLALLELHLSASPAELGGGFELTGALDVPRRLEESFTQRSGSLPDDTQMLLLVAAADPTGDITLLWQAAAHLGIEREAAAPAEIAGLLELDTRVRFRHPLVRSAVYQAATPPDRRRAHAALVEATDPDAAPDRRAWHRAKSVLGTDEEVASELERSAGRARARGGLAAAAAFLHQAVALTPEPARRAGRALEAARAKHAAGAFDAASEMLTIAEIGPLDALQDARLALVRAQVAFHVMRGSMVPEILLDAAKLLAPIDAARSRETYLHAFDAAIITGRLGERNSILEVAAAAANAPAPSMPPRHADLLLDGLVLVYTQGDAAGVPQLRRVLHDMCTGDGTEKASVGGTRRWLWLASRAALLIYDDELVFTIAERNVRLAREAGALAALPIALSFLSNMSVLAGQPGRAADLIDEEAAITEATAGVPLHFGRLVLAAWTGREAETTSLHAVAVRDAMARGNGAEIAMAQLALAVLHNGLGNYTAALSAAEQACEYVEAPFVNLALPELVEAAIRADEPARAAAALAHLGSRAEVTGTAWALGLAACARALAGDGPQVEAWYLEAVEQLSACRMVAHLARARLLYGEWLRREGRRQDAREQLRAAHELLLDMGAEAFAERAARELRATGEQARRRTARPTDELTAQELHIAKLVATGATSREVGAQLYLSPRTIEAHLRSIFRKLDITSRRQLRDIALP